LTRFDALLDSSPNPLPIFCAGSARPACPAVQSAAGRRPAADADAVHRLGHGVCRDATNLFLAACRSLGAPARFVSGYQANADTPDGRRRLHAWPEAFAAGLGWLGYDPTHGVKVSDGYVSLCAAPGQAATMPVEGGCHGGGVTSTLDS